MKNKQSGGQEQVWETQKNQRDQVRTLDCRRPPGNSSKLWKQTSDHLWKSCRLLQMDNGPKHTSAPPAEAPAEGSSIMALTVSWPEHGYKSVDRPQSSSEEPDRTEDLRNNGGRSLQQELEDWTSCDAGHRGALPPSVCRGQTCAEGPGP